MTDLGITFRTQLGPNGASNGCVSFRDYYAFLNAYRSMGIRKLAVVARID